MLTSAVRERIVAAGAVVGSPLRSSDDVLNALMEGEVDGAIVDVAIDTETLLPLSTILENADVPFIFASRTKLRSGGYSLSSDTMELQKIAYALFGPPGSSSTLH